MEETYNVGERIHEVYMLKFKNALHKRVVEFQYKKKNGELRTAHGTLSEEFIGEDNMPKGTGIDVSIMLLDIMILILRGGVHF